MSMMPDRTKAPELKPIQQFEIPQPERARLANNTELLTINMGESDVMRIDFMFPFGKWHQSQNLTATFANLLMKEGAGSLSSGQIAEKLDYHGAWLQNSVTQHNSYITIYLLNKHLEQLLPIIESIVKDPAFPQQELQTIVNRHKEQHKINQEKVGNLCLEASVAQLFGANHPYGRHASVSDFENLNRENVAEFYLKHYRSVDCKIMLTGKVNDQHKSIIAKRFGDSIWGNNTTFETPEHPIDAAKEKQIKIEKPQAVQSAVRIAAPTINREHPDYHALRVLCTVLGGYFGSRLMTSIREEKGYTYGIGASVSTQQRGSYISISTQTGSEYVNPLVEAVFDEIKRLQEEQISSDELERVRNYMMGDFTRSFDGPFAIADAHISLLANNLTPDYYAKQIETIKQIEAEQLRQLAEKYLSKDLFYLAIAGQ